MLSPFAISRPSVSTCLRCQLRDILFQVRAQPPAKPQCRFLSVDHARHDALHEAAVSCARKPHVWKHVKLQDRVIGRPGRRQRVASERLATDSLKEPSSIIVFSDVKDAPDTSLRLSVVEEASSQVDSASRALSAKDVKSIEDAVLGQEMVPEVAEVNASIDALRPENTVVDKVVYDQHRNALSRGYTFEQLSTYLISSLPSPGGSLDITSGYHIDNLSTSGWRPGSSPLSKRHVVIPKNISANTKAKAIERILQHVWQLALESENQAVGELEIQLNLWQMALLFDLTQDGKPYFECLVSTQVLLESTRVEACRPDNVVRITARRLNAEEIARQLKANLLSVKPLEVQLGPYVTLHGRSETAIVPGHLFRDEDVRYVSDITKCIIFQDSPHTFTIHGISPSRSYNARRLLLSLLEIPPPTSFNGTFDIVESGFRPDRRLVRHHVSIDPHVRGMHRRFVGRDLYRLVEARAARYGVAQSQKAATKLDGSLQHIARRLAEKLLRIPSHHRCAGSGSSNNSTYWRGEARVSDWKAEFCTMFQAPIENEVKSEGTRSLADTAVVLSGTPGTETLLSYFEARELPRPLNPSESGISQKGDVPEHSKPLFDRRMPYLISHFVPSPSAAKHHPCLPRIEMRFRFSSQRSSTQTHELKLLGLKATLDEQHLKVSIPHNSADLQFSRETSVVSNSTAAMSDKNIYDFWANLQDSVQSGQGALIAPPSVIVKMPQWMLNDGAAGDETVQDDVAVEYYFERFQQVQTLPFVPSTEARALSQLAPGARTLIEAFPKDHYLAYGEIEGGAIHGSQTSLSLHRRQPSSSAANRLEQQSEGDEASMLLQTAKSDHVEGNDMTSSASSDALLNTSDNLALQLTTTALEIAQLLTQANAGTIRGVRTD